MFFCFGVAGWEICRPCPVTHFYAHCVRDLGARCAPPLITPPDARRDRHYQACDLVFTKHIKIKGDEQPMRCIVWLNVDRNFFLYWNNEMPFAAWGADTPSCVAIVCIDVPRCWLHHLLSSVEMEHCHDVCLTVACWVANKWHTALWFVWSLSCWWCGLSIFYCRIANVKAIAFTAPACESWTHVYIYIYKYINI